MARLYAITDARGLPSRLTGVRLGILLAAVLTLVAVLLSLTPAEAHGKRVRSRPADGAVLSEAPSDIRIWFNEAIDGDFSTLNVTDEDGRAVPVTFAGVDPNDDTVLAGSLSGLDAEVYTVAWKVLSKGDSHVTAGTIVFRVGAGPPVSSAAAGDSAAPVSLAEVVLKWLGFGLMGVLVGGMAVTHLVLQGSGAALRRARRRALAAAAAAGALSLVIGAGLLLQRTVSLSGLSLSEAITGGDWWRVLSDTRFGSLWLARECALLAMTLAAVLDRRGVRQAGRAALVLAPALAVAQALNSHAAALTRDSLPAVASDAVHLLAAAVWVGGLFALVVALRPLTRSGDRSLAALARAGWRRFGVLAAACLGLLMVTGLYGAGRQVASLDALITTLYGQALIGKVTLVLAVSVLGLANGLLLRPRLAASLARLFRRPSGSAAQGWRRQPALVLVEASLGVVVFLAAALITSVGPARGPEFAPPPADAPSYRSQPVDDLVLTLSARPNRPGQNIFTVGVLNTRRPPLAETLGVTLRLTPPEGGRTLSDEAAEVSPGEYRLSGDYLSDAGSWQIDVVAHRSGLPDAVSRFDWSVPPLVTDVAPRSVLVSSSPLEGPLTAATVTLAVLLIAAAVAMRLTGRLSRQPPSGGDASTDRTGPEAWRSAT